MSLGSHLAIAPPLLYLQLQAPLPPASLSCLCPMGWGMVHPAMLAESSGWDAWVALCSMRTDIQGAKGESGCTVQWGRVLRCIVQQWGVLQWVALCMGGRACSPGTHGPSLVWLVLLHPLSVWPEGCASPGYLEIKQDCCKWWWHSQEENFLQGAFLFRYYYDTFGLPNAYIPHW